MTAVRTGFCIVPVETELEMKRLIIIEWIIILLALVSLWPVIIGDQPGWYYGILVAVLLALIWVTRNRVLRTQKAAQEAREKHDEATKHLRRPPLE